MREASRGDAFRTVLILLGCLGGLGTWNYVRNTRAEQEAFRPYQGYSEKQLDQLISAYEADLGRLTDRYEEAKARRAKLEEGTLLGDRVRAFERARRARERVRRYGSEVSQREASLRDFQAERSYREANKQRLRQILRRLFTIRLREASEAAPGANQSSSSSSSGEFSTSSPANTSSSPSIAVTPIPSSSSTSERATTSSSSSSNEAMARGGRRTGAGGWGGGA